MSSVGSAADPAVTTASVVPLVPAWRVDRAFDYAVPDGVTLEVRSLVRMPFGHRDVRGIVTAVDTDVHGELEYIKKVVAPGPVAPPMLPALLDWICNRYCAPRGRVYKACVPDRVRVRVPAAVALVPSTEPVLAGYSGVSALTEARAGAWVVRPGHGERASVIRDLVEIGARRGGAVLIALPEVATASAILSDVLDRWPEAARLGSSEGPGERSSAWYAMSAGHGLAIGGRSVVLAPARPLSAIVVVEETHPSFKDERSPRAETWRIALRRAQMENALALFVSACPSLELAHRVTQGDMGLVEPSRAAERSSRPLIELLPREEGRTLSTDLHQRMSDTLRAGSNVALVVPQRGWARTLWCAGCRRSLRCKRCDGGLAVERNSMLRCPRCGDVTERPDRCPYCAATEFLSIGAGTERVEQQLAKAFPRYRIVRLDDGLPDGEAHDPTVFVTTLATTKEDVRPPVSLVGLLDADALIRRPDLRAAERAHRTLSSLCAWAGPASGGGRMVIQTAEPSHHAIQAVVRSDLWYFVERELPVREELGYPPFSELIKVSAIGPEARGVIEAVAGAARDEHARVLGPITVRDPRSGDERLELLLKCDDAMLVSAVLRGILPSSPHGTRVRVDVDPR